MSAEPAHHQRVEDPRMLDIREMTRSRDFLVAAARNERGDPLVFGGRRSLIIGTTDDQARNFERRQACSEIEIQDRGGTAEEAAGAGADNGIADLPPATGIAQPEGVGEPALHRAVGQGRQRVGLGRGRDARRPSRLRIRQGGRQGVAQHQRFHLFAVVDRKGLADHAADRQADIVDLMDAECIDDRSDIGSELIHRVVPGDRIATAMTAHVNAQQAEPRREQGWELFGPHATIGRQ